MMKFKFVEALRKGIDKAKDEKHATDLFINELLPDGKISSHSKNVIDLDWWEPLNKEPKLVLGGIYVMSYVPTRIEIRLDEKKIIDYLKDYTFEEILPTLLLLKAWTDNEGTKWLQGINLNYCPKELRANILDEIVNIDPDYFENRIYEEVKSGNFKWSDKIQKALQTDSYKTLYFLNKSLLDKWQIKNLSIFIRTYSIKKVKTIRFVDYWMWKYVVDLNYSKCVDGKSLKSIQKLLTSSSYRSNILLPEKLYNSLKISNL